MNSELTDKQKEMQINLQRVHGSMGISILAVFALLVLIALGVCIYDGEIGRFGTGLVMCFWLMLVGAIFWFPSLIVCYIIERIVIKEKFTRKQLGILLFIEALIPFTAIHFFTNTWEIYPVLSTFGIAMVAQSVRWIYLTHNNRLYKI